MCGEVTFGALLGQVQKLGMEGVRGGIKSLRSGLMAGFIDGAAQT